MVTGQRVRPPGWGQEMRGQPLLLNFLIYFLLPGFYSPHIFSVPPYLSDGIPVSSYLGIFFPFHTNLQQGFEMKRKKKDIKCRIINLTRRNTPKRSQDVPIMCCLNNSNTTWRVKRAENNSHILNEVLFNMFSLREVALKLQLASESHMRVFLRTCLPCPQSFRFSRFGVELKNLQF